MQKSKLTLAVMGALFAMSANAGTYVVQANKWGATQEAAVAAAGGTVVYASAGAGVAVVDSGNPGFAEAIKASRAVTNVDADVVLNFKVPQPEFNLDAQAVPNLANETFYNAQWNLKAVQAEQAWAYSTGAGVRVAIVDGGVYDLHPDLSTKLDKARSRNFTKPTSECGTTFADWNCDTGTFWHGTHVAGIVGARGGNSGTVGVAPDATLISVKALHSGTGSFGWIIAGILYAADPIAEGGAGADIINMSLGAETPRKQNGGLVAALNRVVNYATARGTLVVVAAGNSALDMDKVEVDLENGLDRSTIVVPAESGNAIAVSATSPMGYALGSTDYSRPASYSNYGNFIWVSGPGGDDPLPGNAPCAIAARPAGSIAAPCWAFDLVLAPSRAGYSFAAGTSMAAPAVAGVAALIKAKYPNASAAQLKVRLAQSAVDAGKVGQDNFYGHGMVNALRAVTQ